VNVLVVGMHRSGTSVATRVLSLLGPALCRPGDLVRGHLGNQRGHWESAPLVVENDRLLREVRSRWWCPPADLEVLLADTARVEAAGAVLRASHPVEPWVWKDPRTSLLVPLWRRALAEPPVILFVYRHPAEVATSLRIRSRFTTAFSLALWERYVALAAEGMRGLPTFVTGYDELLADPVGWSGRVADFLTVNGVDARVPTDTSGIEGFVNARLRHDDGAGDGILSPGQRAQWAALRDWQGGDLDVPAADSATTMLFDEVRDAFGLGAEQARPIAGTFVSTTGVRVLDAEAPRRPTSRKPVSVLLLPRGGSATAADAAALRPNLPEGAEIITVGEQTGDDGLLVVHREDSLPLAKKINLAAELSRGDPLLVLAGPPVRPCRGWLPELRRALALRDVGAVGPALHPLRDGPAAYGLVPTGGFPGTEWDLTSPAQPGPVPALSITAFATSRRAFEAVGGFDEGLTGSGGEDLDYCLRLWRSGWRCLAAPGAAVRVAFEMLPAATIELMTNALRLAVVHLGPEALAATLTELSALPEFAAALAHVTAGDAARRRLRTDAVSWYAGSELTRISGVPLDWSRESVVAR
jgi:hypothetical protein